MITKERLLKKMVVRDGCWEWQGETDPYHGYGYIWEGGRGSRFLMVHRAAWELWHGPIPPGMKVLHECDNRKCFRPSHLFLGTQKDNLDDASRKGRLFRVWNRELVAAIKADPRPTRIISRELAVPRRTVRDIKNGVIHRHIKPLTKGIR